MRAYVITTCVIWFSMVAVHGWHVYMAHNMAGHSGYLAVAIVAAVLGCWALWVLRRAPAA
jgi:hypothetical protein